MLNLTRQERYVVYFLIVFFLIGGAIHLYKVNFSTPPVLSNSEARRDSLQKKVARNDSLYFSSSEEQESRSFQEPVKIEINTATREELMKIKGIGPVTAERILKYRKKSGNIKSLQELTNVKGIGSKTVEKIKNEVTIE